jgi:hypothetical protein
MDHFTLLLTTLPALDFLATSALDCLVEVRFRRWMLPSPPLCISSCGRRHMPAALVLHGVGCIE